MTSPKPEADHYLELSFSGGTLLGGADTGEIYPRIHDAASRFFKEWNDYSHGGVSFSTSENITIHVDGALVWGEEP